MTYEQMNFRCPVSLKKAIEQGAKRLNLTQTELVIRLLEYNLEHNLEALKTGSLALASHTNRNPSQPVPDVQDSQIAALKKRLINDTQVIFERLDSLDVSCYAHKLAINQRVDTLEKTLTTLARQQELANSSPCHQLELDLHLAKIDSCISSYAALQVRVDELTDNFAQLERLSVTLPQQNGDSQAQFNSSLQEQISQLFMEVEKVKKAIAQSASSSTPAQEANASQESLPLSSQSNEPVPIDEQSLTNPASSPTEPSPDSSNSAESWLTLGEAYKIARAKGYEGKIDTFRAISTGKKDYTQVYAQYGLKANLKRVKRGRNPSKYFCRLS